MAKDWIKKSIKHPGAFHAWCVAHGFPGATAEAIARAKMSGDPHVVEMANEAKTLEGMHK